MIRSVDTVDTECLVGVIGLGVMGTGIARSLERAGFRLRLHNREAARAESLRSSAALPASLREVGQRCRVVVLSLPDTAAVESVLWSADGLASSLEAGSCIIDTSTISGLATRRFAADLGARDIAFLDAPVSGGEKAAASGSLSCMVGGDEAAFKACSAVFGALARNTVYMGRAGNGQITKACNQVAVSGALLGVAEALALANRQGVAPKLVREVLLGGAAASFSLDKHGQRIIDGDFAPGFRAVLMRKDLRLALDVGQDGGHSMPTAALAAQLLDEMCKRGDADLDWSALGALVEQQADSSDDSQARSR